METKRAELVEIRPGRTVFFRQEVLCGRGGSNNQDIKIDYNLVILHGTCAASSQFDLWLPELAKTIEERAVCCYLYDAISCGKSPLVKDWKAYETEQAVLDLHAILENQIEDPTLPTILMGHSYAPTVLVRYLNRFQTTTTTTPRIAGCVLLSSAVRSESNPVPDGGHSIFVLPVVVLNCLQPSLSKSFVQAAYHTATADPQLLQDALQTNDGNDMYMAKAYHQHHKWLSVPDECRRVQNLATLVVHGQNDLILPPQAGQHLADAIRAQQFVVIDNASHQVMQEQPKELAKVVSSFVKSLLDT